MAPQIRRIRMRHTLFAALLASAALLLVPPTASAQWRSEPTGFHAAAFLNGSAITYEDDDEAESGGGVGFVLGWGLGNLVTLYLEGVAADVEFLSGGGTYTLTHADLGARFNFRSMAKRWRPYAKAAVTGLYAETDILGNDIFSISGAGVTVGGGIAYFISRKFAVDAGLEFTGGSFSEAELAGLKNDIDVSATSTRFNLGMSFWNGHR